MKKVLRLVLFYSIAIYSISRFSTGLSYGDNIKTLFLASAALTAATFFVKPILKLITLPINFITLGLSSWLIDVLMLYAVTIIVPGFSINSFVLNEFYYNGFVIPGFYFNQISAVFAVSFLLAFFVNTFSFICD